MKCREQTNTLAQTQTAFTVLLRLGSLGSWTKIFPSQPKTHFFGDIVDFVVYKQNDKSFSS